MLVRAVLGVTRWTEYIQENTNDFNPVFASSEEA